MRLSALSGTSVSQRLMVNTDTALHGLYFERRESVGDHSSYQSVRENLSIATVDDTYERHTNVS
jgi:hypothetical protein